MYCVLFYYSSNADCQTPYLHSPLFGYSLGLAIVDIIVFAALRKVLRIEGVLICIVEGDCSLTKKPILFDCLGRYQDMTF